MVRLQRVTFTALHQYLGLSSELIQNVSIYNIETYRFKYILKIKMKTLEHLPIYHYFGVTLISI